jgi:BirA family transcriptional regulator, biotin operon repressor / biotin---[acetyl-CoA-carboxylase] ligase
MRHDKNFKEEILRLFREKPDEHLSGEQISHALGVTRTAIWKQIQTLRDLGYEIEAVTARGYRLVSCPDTLIPAEIQSGLNTLRIGRKVVYLAETDSTNARIRELGDAGADEGLVVIAEQQSAGRGRMGRQWVSPPGVNLYTSVLLRPPILPHLAPQMTFLSAVAVARAVEDIGGLEVAVKWPNDILLSGKKVAGLLNEMDAETEGIHYIVLGIGVNLNMTAEQFPADLRYPATSLALERGTPVSRLDFARSLYGHLDSLYELFLDTGFEPIVRAWESLCDMTGKQVEVDCLDRILRGRVEGLDSDGALLLRTEHGILEKILAGDVRPL